MPPKRKANMPAARGAAAKKYQMAPILPEGEVLADFQKKQWRLGKSFATGGFGRIYFAKQIDSTVKGKYVIKMEPAENGPLFQEFHVYCRILKPQMIESFKVAKRLDFLGVPPFYGAGLVERNGFKYRFIILQHLGADLEKIRERQRGGKFADETAVFRLALTCLNAYEYLHANFYVHADLKADNLLLDARENDDSPNLHIWNSYLLDYGLAKRIPEKPVYHEQPKKAHDGTLIFTSLDAHRGCSPSYRGDVEILGYNLIYWLHGSLPWSEIATPEKVFERKLTFSKHVKTELSQLFGASFPCSDGLNKLLTYAYDLQYDRKPDFDRLRAIVGELITKSRSGVSVEKLPTAAARNRATVKEKKIKEDPPVRSPSKKRPSVGRSSVLSKNDSVNSEEDLFNPQIRKPVSTKPKYLPVENETADSSTEEDIPPLTGSVNKFRSEKRVSKPVNSMNKFASSSEDELDDDFDAHVSKPSCAKGASSRRGKTAPKMPMANRRLSTLEASLLKKYRNPSPTAGNLPSKFQNGIAPKRSASSASATSENGTQTSPRLSERWLANRRKPAY